jgi:hypothetical protein
MLMNHADSTPQPGKPAWSARVERSGAVLGLALEDRSGALAYREVIERWADDPAFRAWFARVVAAAPFEACFFETPCVDAASAARPFECVLVDAPGLAGVAADERAFAEHFRAAPEGEAAIAFRNLGGDALLVAPMPGPATAASAHLAAFSRAAPAGASDSLWRIVGRRMRDETRHRPVWLSTSGLGVYWLHLRLDARPKYYTHVPYRVPLRGR